MKPLKRITMAVVLVAGLFALLGYWVFRLPVFGAEASVASLLRMQQSKQFHGARFENTPPYVSIEKLLT